MILTEYKKEEELLSVAEEHETIGTLRTLDAAVTAGYLTLEQAAQLANLTVAEFQAKVAELKEPVNA